MNSIRSNYVCSRNELTHWNWASKIANSVPCLNVHFARFLASRIAFGKTNLIVTWLKLITNLWRRVSIIWLSIFFITFLILIYSQRLRFCCVYLKLTNIRRSLKILSVHHIVKISCNHRSWSTSTISYFNR